MKMPLVSVLISSYNAEKYIEEAISSALRQTYLNIEVIVIDAGSTDRTSQLVRALNDRRIRFMQHAYEPIKVTRNALLKEAKGDFLTFLDSDDIYLAEKVEEEVKFLEQHSEYAAVYCDLRYFFDGDPERLYRHRYTFYSGDIFPQLLEKMFITNTTLMFRRAVVEKIGGYDERLGMVEDWDYFLRMAHAGFHFGFLPKDLVRYRLRWDNHTRFGNQVPIQESAVKIFENLKLHMTSDERERYEIDRHIAKRKERLVVALLAAGKKKIAWVLLGECRTAMRTTRLLLVVFLFVIPSVLLRFVIERAWKWKKRNLFVPVH